MEHVSCQYVGATITTAWCALIVNTPDSCLDNLLPHWHSCVGLFSICPWGATMCERDLNLSYLTVSENSLHECGRPGTMFPCAWVQIQAHYSIIILSSHSVFGIWLWTHLEFSLETGLSVYYYYYYYYYHWFSTPI